MDWIGEAIVGIFISLIEMLFNSLIAPFQLIPSLKDLVFGRNADGDMIWKTFEDGDISNALSPIYNTTLTIAFILMVAFIILFGMRLSSSTMNPAKRLESMQFAGSLLLVAIGLYHLPSLFDILFAINSAIVDLFSASYESTLDAINEQEAISGNATDAIGRMLISLVLIGLAVWANFYYMMRRISLLLLMGLAPIFLVAWLHPKFKGLTANWFRELVSTIFIQSIHAFTYFVLAIISVAESGNLLGMVIVYVVFIPVTIATRSLFMMGGQFGEGIHKAGAAFGLASLAGMVGAVKGAIGGKDLKGAASGALNALKNKGMGKPGSPNALGDATSNGDLKDTLGAAAGKDEGTNKKAEKMLKNGEALANLGRGTLGAMGAIAGAGLGQGGVLSGTALGYGMGGVVGGVTGRVGTAALDMIGDKIKDGKNAVNALSENGGEGDPQLDHVAEQLANKEYDNWRKDNGAKLKEDLRSRYPDISESELNDKFQEEGNKVKEGFKKAAKQSLQSAQNYAQGHAEGDSLKQNAPKEMLKQWESESKDKFNEDYAKNFPQQANESNTDYENRRAEAFGQQKKKMLKLFGDATNKIVDMELENSPTGAVSKSNFIGKMSEQLKGNADIGNPEGLSNIGANSGQPISLYGDSGKFNVNSAAKNYAAVKTAKAKADFMNEHDQLGRPVEDSEKIWNSQHQQKTFDDHKQQFMDANVSKGMPSAIPINRENMTPSVMEKVNAFREGSGLTFSNMGKTFAKPVINGAKELASNYTMGLAQGQSVPMAMASSIGRTISGAVEGIKNNGIEKHGSAIEAQHAFENKVGYMGGVAFGVAGYQRAKRLGAKVSPYAQSAQEESYTASDVMQMASTYTDESGTTRVSPGAIRQVVTPNDSFIEVTTKGGQVKRVSRKTAGHSGLKDGDMVYQDLDVQNGMLVPVAAGGGASTYRLDIGGARIPSDVQVMRNPNTLLRQPHISNSAKPSVENFTGMNLGQSDTTPTYSPVEAKQLAASYSTGTGEAKTIPGALRQVVSQEGSYVEVQNANGVYKRVTQIGQGNPNLKQGQVVYQDLDVSDNGQYIPVPAGIEGDRTATSYVLNSNGGRQKSHVPVTQSAKDLVTNVPSTEASGKQVVHQRREVPMYSQKVDAGQFLVDDLGAEQMQQIEVVVEHDRRYVTATKNGETYRVSPVTVGDTRVPPNEVRRIPVTVHKGQLLPVQSEAPYTAQAVVERYVNGEVIVTQDVYSTLNGNDNLIPKEIMKSRYQIQAQRNVDNRRNANELRRKQGILG